MSKTGSQMEKARKHGQMEHSTLETLWKASAMGGVDSFTPTVVNTLDQSNMERNMVKELKHGQMVRSMWVSS